MSSPRPDLLTALPGLAAEQIQKTLPGLATCKGMIGRYDISDVKRDGLAAPAVLVSLLGARQAQSLAGPFHCYDLSFAAFVVTKDMVGLTRDGAAVTIVQTLLRLVPENNWRQVGVGAAREVTAQPLITAEAKASAISLWAVTWTQTAQFQSDPISAEVPLTLYVGIAPRIGADHVDHYERIT